MRQLRVCHNLCNDAVTAVAAGAIAIAANVDPATLACCAAQRRA
jgi:hypothetical protein